MSDWLSYRLKRRNRIELNGQIAILAPAPASEFMGAAVMRLGEQFKFHELFPDFMPQVVELTRDFTQFNKHAIVIFNSIHPDCDWRTSLNHSAVCQWCDAVIREWTGLVVQLNDVINHGLLRFFPILASAIDRTSDAIVELSNLYFVGCLSSNVPSEALNEIQIELKHWRLTIQSQTADSELDLGKFLEAVQRIVLHVNNTFLIVSPRFTFSSGELIQRKLDVKIALKQLTELTSAVVRFEEAMTTVNHLTFLFNNDLMDVIRDLRIPWRITLTSLNGKGILIEGIDSALPHLQQTKLRLRSPGSRDGALCPQSVS
jgi:hypothetical protein